MRIFVALAYVIACLAALAMGLLLERLGVSPRVVANMMLLLGLAAFLASALWPRRLAPAFNATPLAAGCGVAAQAIALLAVLAVGEPAGSTIPFLAPAALAAGLAIAALLIAPSMPRLEARSVSGFVAARTSSAITGAVTALAGACICIALAALLAALLASTLARHLPMEPVAITFAILSIAALSALPARSGDKVAGQPLLWWLFAAATALAFAWSVWETGAAGILSQSAAVEAGARLSAAGIGGAILLAAVMAAHPAAHAIMPDLRTRRQCIAAAAWAMVLAAVAVTALVTLSGHWPDMPAGLSPAGDVSPEPFAAVESGLPYILLAVSVLLLGLSALAALLQTAATMLADEVYASAFYQRPSTSHRLLATRLLILGGASAAAYLGTAGDPSVLRQALIVGAAILAPILLASCLWKGARGGGVAFSGRRAMPAAPAPRADATGT